MYLLDTNVLSEPVRRRPDVGVLAWLGSIGSAAKFVSVVTLGELRHGVELARRRDRARGAKLDHWLADVIESFGRRVLAVDAPVGEQWGRLGVPDRVPDVDGLIAATAMVHGLTVVTRNVRDFERCGVATINPFSSGQD